MVAANELTSWPVLKVLHTVHLEKGGSCLNVRGREPARKVGPVIAGEKLGTGGVLGIDCSGMTDNMVKVTLKAGFAAHLLVAGRMGDVEIPSVCDAN